MRKYHKELRTEVSRRRNQKPTRLTNSSAKTSIRSEDKADMEKLAAAMAQLPSSQQQFQQQLVNSQQQFQQLQQKLQHQNQVQQRELQQQLMDQQEQQQ